MKITYDDNYGADADGNRGISVIDDITLDEDDAYEVRAQIIECYEGESFSDNIDIYLSVEGELQDFNVEISEWLTEDELDALKIGWEE